MLFSPSWQTFKDHYLGGKAQVIVTSILADFETPITAMCKIMRIHKTYTLLFESVEGGNQLGRYSILGFAPDKIWKCTGGKAYLHETSLQDCSDAGFIPQAESALDSLKGFLNDSTVGIATDSQGTPLPPMAAGVFGTFGYDMVRLIETLPDTKKYGVDIPDCVLMRPSIILIFDTVTRLLHFCSPVWTDSAINGEESAAQEAYTAACFRIQSAIELLHYKLDTELVFADSAQSGQSRYSSPDPESYYNGTAKDLPFPADWNVTSNTSYAQFIASVTKAKEYIAAGDIFQVVPSQRFSIPFAGDAFAYYRMLRRINPAPFLFYLQLGDHAVIGSSPEILVRIRDNTITVRPIAGTRPRGKTPSEDIANAADLSADPKERAEHLMLLDLGRNDVGRVAEIGSVAVEESFVIENYSHVMHLVSRVTGKLAEGKTNLDAFFSGFPAGTVSGAPKIRAMEIIEDLEPTKRGLYGGGVGYFGIGGSLDTCIALRTAVLHNETLYVQAGGGVVADSDPVLEYLETCNKGAALLKAAVETLRQQKL